MTEEKAKETRCCGTQNCGQEREVAEGDYRKFCIGSKCMAWRLDHPATDTGFCGLAGRQIA